MSKILYVSSFNKRLYKLSATRLINSFLGLKIEGDLLLTYEVDKKNKDYMEFLKNLNCPKIKLYNLSEDDYLNNWLNENKEYIPKKYGGNYNDEKSSILIKNLMNNSSNYNSKASLWFRKIASLNYTLKNHAENYDYIVWIDIDCFFKQYYPKKFIIKNFQNTCCFYHLGKRRLLSHEGAIESGFIGFKKKEGYNLLQDVINIYKNQEFLKYKRWDDGFIFSVVILGNNKYKTIDLSNNNNLISSEALRMSPFNNYIKHCKGSHFRLDKKNLTVKNYLDFEKEILKNI